MKNWNLFSFNKVFFAAFFVLAVINSLAVIIEDDVLLLSIKSLSVPVFLIFFYVKNNKINMSLMIFLAFAFLSESSGVLFPDLNVVCTESLFYCFAFMQLIVLILPKFKFIQLDGLIKAYLLMMFGVTLFFFKVLYDLVGVEFLERAEVMLFSTKSFILVILVFVAYGVYLHIQSKQSILFLIAAVCFGFSCVLDYLNFSFINNWSFMVLNRIIYLFGMYFIFRFVIEENKCKTHQGIQVQEHFAGGDMLV